ncbi:MAG TPA: PAS domain-containing protein, partial [Flavisolibacter sp.]|nr:PAS domain-containing protein [Flavisolibacter sp.]
MSQTLTGSAYLFQGKGEAVRLMNDRDWLQSSMGPVTSWPQNLLFSIEILLRSDLPMFLFWGSDHLFFYNDAFQFRSGNNGVAFHGQGQPGKQFWRESWQQIEPQINAVIEGYGTGLNESLILSTPLPDTIKTANRIFQYHPVKNDEGRVQGVLAIGGQPAETSQYEETTNSFEEQLQFALAACDLGTWELNTQTMQFRCNQKTKEIFGLHDLENIGLDKALAVIHADDRQTVTEAIHKALDYTSGGKYNVEYTVVHP